MQLNRFNQSLTIAGPVTSVDLTRPSFSVKARSGDVFEAIVGPTTSYQVLTNLDQLSQDRVEDPPETSRDDDVLFLLQKYVARGRPLFVSGLYQEDGDRRSYEARTVYLLHSDPTAYLFEETHWWLTQVTHMADRILDHLFDARRTYTIDDFSKLYRTNLNILGQPVDETVQESAVLSRLIYDLSSAYLMTGAERYILAARAAVHYLREAFRILTHEGEHCFWAYGRRRNVEGERGENLIQASQGPDDAGSIPLYEQIYALAGLTQYYRITLDWEVLEDIRRTINTFQDFYWDPTDEAEQRKRRSNGFAGTGGYYSHLDPVTMRPDTPALGDNRSRKNWNSIGDHIPAYLVNLILALEPLPQGRIGPEFKDLLAVCHEILAETSSLIVERFPDPNPEVPYVNERFHADWTPDHSYRWQQNRAVVGHNLKIAWNLTRCAYYFQTQAKRLRDGGKAEDATGYEQRSKRCLDLACQLADGMSDVGLDNIRGGIFDCVEREPQGGMTTQFAWQATKDFWQQEQGILAYLILHGASASDETYLQLARECSAFWNLFFLDRERQGYFFRTSENGGPIIEGQYGMRGGHAIGYHAFELSYLAHIYTRTFISDIGDNTFSLYFKICYLKQRDSINVLPDFMPPGRVRISRVRANGVDMTERLDPANLDQFQVPTDDMTPDPTNGTVELVVEFQAKAA